MLSPLRSRLWLVTMLLALVVGCGDSMDRSSPLSEDESAALSGLISLQRDLENFRKAAWIDRDGDGSGEFPFLGELLERTRERFTNQPRREGLPVLPPLTRLKLTPVGDGDYRMGRVRVRLLLPGAETQALRELADGHPAQGVDSKLAERRVCLYVWLEGAQATHMLAGDGEDVAVGSELHGKVSVDPLPFEAFSPQRWSGRFGAGTGYRLLSVGTTSTSTGVR